MTQAPTHSIDVRDLLRPHRHGQVVNPHVVPHHQEPSPDYEAMRRVVHGSVEPSTVQDPHRR